MKRIPITAMIPAYRRVAQTISTIGKLQACNPAPDEILVHIDSRVEEMRSALREPPLGVRVLESEENLGPGGGRNRMLEEATHEIVVSFDDDSYPPDADFFARVAAWVEQVPEAAILATNIFEPGDPVPSADGEARWVADFVGCGCVYRRSVFLKAPGYVPIPIAYSMEEADLALRYTARGERILFVPDLRVYHDTHLTHHASAEVAAAQVANVGLFVILRYPWQRWPLGMVQFAHKWWDALRRKRFRGALRTPLALRRQIAGYHTYRAPVTKEAFDRHRLLRKRGGFPL